MYYSPVCRFTVCLAADFSLDLHVLNTPPAFALSQDQTLQKRFDARYKTHNNIHFQFSKNKRTLYCTLIIERQFINIIKI